MSRGLRWLVVPLIATVCATIVVPAFGATGWGFYCGTKEHACRYPSRRYATCFSIARVPRAPLRSALGYQRTSLRDFNRDTASLAASTAQSLASNPALFQLQSNFWVNLNDILYRHAQTPHCLQGEINGECAHYFDMSVGDEAAWRAAVNWYADNLAKRTLAIDDQMIRIDNVLSELAPDANLDHRGLPDGLVDALRTAAPVYQKYYWPDQDYFNRKWIETVTPRLERYGAQIAQQLARIYDEPWPTTPIRVDVVAFAGETGAYTTLGPTHIVISSLDRRNQGDSGFEILFHEASRALSGKLWDELAQAFKARNKRQPLDLWHVLLFYTTGELVRRVIPGYTPYADRNDIYKNEWVRFRELLDRDWKPYLDGKTDRETAIGKLAADY